MKRKEDIVCYDFQGWPEYKMTWREILISLGFELMQNEGNEYLRIKNTDPLLDIYPKRVRDDGMGYMIGDEFVIQSESKYIVTEPQSTSEELEQQKNYLK